MTRYLFTFALTAALGLMACGDDLPPPLSGNDDAASEVEQDTLVDVDEADTTAPLADTGPDLADIDEIEANEVTEDVQAPEVIAPPEDASGDADAEDDTEEDVIEEPFVCTDNASCDGRIEVALCEEATCVAGHCAALPDPDLEGQSCDDGNACSTGNICQGGLCTTGVPIDCSALAAPPCTLGVCDASQGGCVSVLAEEGLACDDGDPCTESDACVSGACQGLSLCDDGDVCNGYEGCDPATGACSSGVPLTCDGTDPCLGTSFCDAIFGCVVGAPPDCGTFVCGDDGCPSSCLEHAQCVSGTFCASGTCVDTLEDGSSCNALEMCDSGHCDSALCCQGGQCCTTDAECPLTEVGVLVSQELYDPESGFARVVVTEATGGLQTLNAPASGVLERVDLMLQTTADEGYLVLVSFWSGVPPEATLLGTTTLLVLTDTAEPTIATAILGEPIAIEEGQTLSVGLSWLNGDADCQIGCGVIWMGAEGDPYPEGTVHRTFDSGGSWHVSEFNDDLWIRLWAGQHRCEDFSCVDAP